jgi:hypothetical protein
MMSLRHGSESVIEHDSRKSRVGATCWSGGQSGTRCLEMTKLCRTSLQGFRSRVGQSRCMIRAYLSMASSLDLSNLRFFFATWALILAISVFKNSIKSFPFIFQALLSLADSLPALLVVLSYL